MSGSQKALKIISIILIVWAILTIAGGAFFCVGGALPGASDQTVSVEGQSLNLATTAMVMGIAMAIGGVIDLIIGILGMRGAKNPAKIGVFFVLCIIGAVLSLIGLGMTIAQGTFNWSSLISLVVIIVCLVLSYNIKKQAN